MEAIVFGFLMQVTVARWNVGGFLDGRSFDEAKGIMVPV